MLFLDEPHLRSIAAALWDGAPYGKASVMIGAGFSKNAISTSSALPNTKSFPGWAELTETMARELHADPEDHEVLERAIRSASSTSGALRIADEYQAWKGRGKLDALLREAIPDEKFKPGPLHNLLFKLPWADILTTNFDTLLERAAADEIDRRYTVVRSQRDIPGSPKPRIVKLHGSFPDSRPFIITEDDFRTYEQTNPVMVNLVQQVFVENTCCLVGFSGDDPNFLKWTGWVRDILSPTHMEPIYLVGLLNHTPARRALLERRHVRSIDLAPLFPAKDWPDPDIRHKAATDWFLRALLHLRPAEFHNWPRPATFEQANPLFQDCPNLPAVKENSLLTEFDRPSHIQSDEESQELDATDYASLSEEEQIAASQRMLDAISRREMGELRNSRIDIITEIWSHNRRRFPGWLVLPWQNRRHLEEATIDWIEIIADAGRQIDKRRSLGWLYELQWRLERCLICWPLALVQTVETLLSAGALEKFLVSHEDASKARALAVQLLRSYREHGDRDSFVRWRVKLTGLVDQRSEEWAFCVHQKALAAAEEWDLESAQTILLDWNVDGIDPIWRARKAALLGELDHHSAREQALQALKEIQAIGPPSDIAARTRETAALWLASVLIPWRSEERRKLDVRREELQRKGFSSSWLAERLGSLIAGTPDDALSHPTRTKADEPTPIEAAYIARRFIEDSASLIRKPGLTADKLASAAIPWMALTSPTAALRLSVRNRDFGYRAPALNRVSLAKIPHADLAPIFSGLVKSIVNLSVQLARQAGEDQYGSDFLGNKPHSPAAGTNWLLQVALPHLRDLSFVLNDIQLKEAADLCLKLRSSWKGGQWQTWAAIETTTESILRQCSSATVREMLSELVEQPIAGLDVDVSNPLAEYDTISQASIRWDSDAKGQPINSNRISYLLSEAATNKSIAVRSRICMRLSMASSWSSLSDEEKNNLTDAAHDILSKSASNTPLKQRDYVLSTQDLLFIPNVSRNFVTAILSSQDWNPLLSKNEDGKITSITMGGGPSDPILVATGLTLEPWLNNGWQLSAGDWANEHVSALLQKAEDWLRLEGLELLQLQKNEPPPVPRYDHRAIKTVEFCRKAVLPLQADTNLVEKACYILELLANSDVQTLSAVSVLLVGGKRSTIQAANEMRKAASSFERSNSVAFMIGLLAWLSQTAKGVLAPPPEDLIHEVALGVRGRRESDLASALVTAKVILKQFKQYADDRFRRDIAVGLQYLAGETDVAAPSLSLKLQTDDLAGIRRSCVDLVRELQVFPEGTDSVQAWKERENAETVRDVQRAFRRLHI